MTDYQLIMFKLASLKLKNCFIFSCDSIQCVTEFTSRNLIHFKKLKV